ncbi:SitI3 family protein [Archangium sp.]|uniref:SitI3 family protein n=1 Tax=Archangium sp. TaxID=1872627 RepID=UPI002D269BB8|nr:SitI3 family protein [Archangium sp.]HYO51453.1 SitI3 family protein [Archangium sp.]
MGLDYSLKLSTDMQPVQVLRLLAERLGLKWWDDSHLGGPAIWIGAIGVSDSGRLSIEEGFHFSPDVSVLFRLDSNSDEYEDGNRVMLRATLLLLEHDRDGVLLFNGERIILQRIAGQLVLNADYGNWTDGLRLEDEIRFPHEKRSLPSPWL